VKVKRKSRERTLEALLNLYDYMKGNGFMRLNYATFKTFGLSPDKISCLIDGGVIIARRCANTTNNRAYEYNWNSMRPSMHMVNKLYECVMKKKKQDTTRVIVKKLQMPDHFKSLYLKGCDLEGSQLSHKLCGFKPFTPSWYSTLKELNLLVERHTLINS
jgi:hypothetical protein